MIRTFPLAPLSALAAATVLATSGPSARAQCTPIELAELTSRAGGDFGYALGLEGDLAVVGAPHLGSKQGRVLVLGRDVGGPDAWGVVVTLSGNENFDDAFGLSVALSGSTLVVGAPETHGAVVDAGKAYVFERDLGGPDNWGLAAELTIAATQSVRFGETVALEGDTLVVSTGGTFSLRQVFIHERDAGGPGNWGLVQTHTEGGLGWNYGRALAVQGDLVLVGSPGAPGGGRVDAYERGAGWVQVATIALPGGVDESFGFALDVDGDRLAIGAPEEAHSGKYSAGAVYVYEQQAPDDWELLGRAALDASSTPKPLADDRLGANVALAGDTLLAGTPQRVVAGRAFVFSQNEGGPNAWQLSTTTGMLLPPGPSNFGKAIVLDGASALIGAGNTFDGVVHVYEDLQAVPASPCNYCTSGVSASGCSATLSALGTPSASAASGFVVTAGGVEGAKDGLFFFGTSGAQSNSWGNGTSFQCVVPPVVRGGLLPGTGTAGACDGALSQDLAALWSQKPAKNPGSGATVHLQLWYRDPFNTSNQTTSLSDGLRFVTTP